MENKAYALAAGAFVLLLSALLVVLSMWLTRQTGGEWSFEVSSAQAVSGLQSQAAVRFKGVKVGKVTDIGFDEQVPGNVLISLAVDEGTPVTRSTYATLGFQGVTGIAFVQLEDGGDAKELLRVAAGQTVRIPMRPSLLSQLSDQGTRILTQLEETSERINQLLATDNQKALIGTLTALGQASANVSALVGEARSTLPSLRAAAHGVTDGAQSVQKTSSELARLAQQVQGSGGPLEQFSGASAALTATLESVQGDTLPRLARATDEVAATARGLGRVSQSLSDNPQVLIFGGPAAAPGPGETGFVSPSHTSAAPATRSGATLK